MGRKIGFFDFFRHIVNIGELLHVDFPVLQGSLIVPFLELDQIEVLLQFLYLVSDPFLGLDKEVISFMDGGGPPVCKAP